MSLLLKSLKGKSSERSGFSPACRVPRPSSQFGTRIILDIGRSQFETAAEGLPSIWEWVASFLARRLEKRVAGSVAPARLAQIRTVAILPAGGSRIPDGSVNLLMCSFRAHSRVVLVTRADIEQAFPGIDLEAPIVLEWLNEFEAAADFVIYRADDDLTSWTSVCLRQADTVLLVAEQSRSPGLNLGEQVVLSMHPPSARRLVLIHDVRSDAVSGTSGWLDRRDVFEHHHVALADEVDIDRLVRFLSGRALGFVAGGGGSLGSAHLGIYKALLEAGIRFDCFGGTSVGAAMMAGAALEVDADQIDRGIHKIFIESRAFGRPTVPRYALLDHKTFDRALRAEYGEVHIEDLWLPYFAVSTNLSMSEPYIHRRGKLWHAVRASESIPGILPPFFTADGDMLVDGAITEQSPARTDEGDKDGSERRREPGAAWTSQV